MVIECPSCKTKFKLPDEKVGPAGVSVRCSKCATTFAVRPPAAAAMPDKTQISAPMPPSPPPSMPATTPSMSVTQTAVSPPPTPAAPPAPTPPPDLFATTQSALSQPDGGTPAPGFGGMSSAFAAGMAATAGGPAAPPPAPIAGFGTPFVGLEMPGVPPPARADDPSTLADESATSDAQPGLDPGLRDALLGSSAPGGSLTDEGDVGMVRDPEAGPANFDFGNDPFGSGASAASGGPQPAPPPAELFAARPVTAPPAPAAAPDIGLATPEKKTGDKTGKKAAKKPVVRLSTAHIARPREPARAYRLLLALFFAGAFASAFASLTDGTFDPERLDRGRLSLLIGPPPAPEGIEGLAITARRGGYVMTAPGKPRVYTAHGIAINESGAAKGYLEVRGRMLDDDGGVLAETTAPCGNSFRDDQLLGFRSGDELRRAYLPAGDGLSNAKVAPGSAVACTIVFFEAPSPEKTAAFELEIVSAQPAS